MITERLKKVSSRHASLRPIKIHADDCHFFKILQRTRPVASGSILNLQSRWLNPRALTRPNGKSRPRERLLQLSVPTTEMLSTYRKARCSHLVLVFFLRLLSGIVWVVKHQSVLTYHLIVFCACVKTNLTTRIMWLIVWW